MGVNPRAARSDSAPLVRASAAVLAGALVVLAGVASGWVDWAYHGASVAPKGVSTDAGEAFMSLLGVGALSGTAVLAWALFSRGLRRSAAGGQDAEEEEAPPLPLWLRVVMMLVPLALLGGLGFFIAESTSHKKSATNGGFNLFHLRNLRPEHLHAAKGGALDWAIIGAAVGVAFLLMLAGGVAATVVAKRAKHPPPPEPLPRDDQTLQELAAPAIDELLAERDPRKAVVAAYASMVASFGTMGVRRRPSETPFEHLSRALHELGAPSRPSERLTSLFEEARFSEHSMGQGDRQEALSALEEISSASPHADAEVGAPS